MNELKESQRLWYNLACGCAWAAEMTIITPEERQWLIDVQRQRQESASKMLQLFQRANNDRLKMVGFRLFALPSCMLPPPRNPFRDESEEPKQIPLENATEWPERKM